MKQPSTHHISIIFLALYTITTITVIFTSTKMASAITPTNPLVIATRLHLGHASHPPPPSQLAKTLVSFAQLASTVGANHAIVAVDAEIKLEGYDLIEEVTTICKSRRLQIEVVPVTPWGKFIPALNAIVMWAAKEKARYLLIASAEVQLTPEVVEVMKHKLDFERTLVVGTVLTGHEYKNSKENDAAADGGVEVELTGRTTPWNTCALWNVPKLALTGFLLVSEGLHPEEDGREGAGGVEEVCTIATLQQILQPQNAEAKLISIPGTSWGQDFSDDEKRREWHERKMLSKVTRAKRQLDLLGLSGTVIHC